MKNKDEFQTLRGFLSGQEPDEQAWFSYSATLRIFGERLDFEEIESNLGVSPTHTHRKGEQMGERSQPFEHDMWLYSPSIDKQRELAEHIDSLWATVKHAKKYLLVLKKVASVDVSLSYDSNIDMAGFEVPHTSLEMYMELEIPFGVSIVIA
jgi:hypothetical protein